MLFDNFINVSNLLSNDDIGLEIYRKKRKQKKTKDEKKNQGILNSNQSTNPTQGSKGSKKQNHHGVYHQGQPKRQTSSCHSLVRQPPPFAIFIICFTGDRSPQEEARQTVGFRSLVAKYIV